MSHFHQFNNIRKSRNNYERNFDTLRDIVSKWSDGFDTILMTDDQAYYFI